LIRIAIGLLGFLERKLDLSKLEDPVMHSQFIVSGSATYEITAGRKFWKQVRDIAYELRFHGHPVDLWESSGWLERRFVFRASPEVIQRLMEIVPPTQRLAVEERREQERERNRDAFVAAQVKSVDEMLEAEAQNTITQNTKDKNTFLTFSEEHGFYVSEPYEDHGGYTMEVVAPQGMVFEGKVPEFQRVWSSSPSVVKEQFCGVLILLMDMPG
jgi:hypothetical protein